MKKTFSPIFASISIIYAVFLVTTSCVPPKQFEALRSRKDTCEAENNALRAQVMELSTQSNELNASLSSLKKNIETMQKDTGRTSKEIRKLQEQNKVLSAAYDKLQTNNDKLLSGSSAEAKKLIAQLNETQEELQKKEDALKNSEKELAIKQLELKEREKKLEELQSVLNRKDSVVNALKNTVASALLGFKDQGLTVEQKNGKVYVSLEERLLFASGSTIVDPKGQEALKQLAKVLDKKPDINIMVEGHTDDVPMKGSGDIKDNWDLSVIRATAVVKILLTGSSIDAKRISAAGRGEFFPIDTAKTPEARKKNRRTEIILTPKLDELLKVLESN